MKKSTLLTIIALTIATLFLETEAILAQDSSSDDWVTSEGKTYVIGSYTAIGTTTATSTLTIQGNQNSDGNPNTGTVLKFRGRNNAGDPWEIYRDNGLTGDLVIANDDGPGTRRESMRFDLETGNVGIGTINPGNFKLAVQGKIGAREVVVTQAAWADHVFGDNYTLPSLIQVETYIKENKHLPDIPSAKEVKEEGLSIAEMMAKQMQKIEELTIYVIEQNKRIESLEKELAKKK